MKNRRLTMIIIALAILLVNVEYSGIPIIIPVIASTLSLTVTQIQWVASAYLLAFFSLLIAAGHLGDMYSQSRIFIIGIVIFIIGSIIGGISIHSWQMLLARVVQGVGAAVIYPNMTAMAFSGTDSTQKSQVAGVIASIVGVTIALGPPLAGFIATYLSWRSFFLLNVPVGIILLLLIASSLSVEKRPVLKSEKSQHFDLAGVVTLVIFLCALMYSLEQFKGGLDHWRLSLATIALALLSAWFFVKIERRASQPIIALALFSNRYLVIYCLIRWTTNFSFYVLFFILGLYFHLVLGYSVLATGFIFLPMSLAISIMSPIGARLVESVGHLLTALAGVLLFLLVFLGFYMTAKHPVLAIDIMLLMVAGCAYGLTSPALITAVMSSVPVEQSGLASGVFYMMSLFGSTVGVTVAGILFYSLHQATIKQTIAYCFPIMMMICFVVMALGGALLCYTQCRSRYKHTHNESDRQT